MVIGVRGRLSFEYIVVFQINCGVSLAEGLEGVAHGLGVGVADIDTVFLAGAFGNYLDPASACRIGMIPPVLADRIVPIGNAAGEGARLCAQSAAEFEYS